MDGDKKVLGRVLALRLGAFAVRFLYRVGSTSPVIGAKTVCLPHVLDRSHAHLVFGHARLSGR